MYIAKKCCEFSTYVGDFPSSGLTKTKELMIGLHGTPFLWAVGKPYRCGVNFLVISSAKDCSCFFRVYNFISYLRVGIFWHCGTSFWLETCRKFRYAPQTAAIPRVIANLTSNVIIPELVSSISQHDFSRAYLALAWKSNGSSPKNNPISLDTTYCQSGEQYGQTYPSLYQFKRWKYSLLNTLCLFKLSSICKLFFFFN